MDLALGRNVTTHQRYRELRSTRRRSDDAGLRKPLDIRALGIMKGCGSPRMPHVSHSHEDFASCDVRMIEGTIVK